jgi:hypothetical protein
MRSPSSLAPLVWPTTAGSSESAAQLASSSVTGSEAEASIPRVRFSRSEYGRFEALRESTVAGLWRAHVEVVWAAQGCRRVSCFWPSFVS